MEDFKLSLERFDGCKSKTIQNLRTVYYKPVIGSIFGRPIELEPGLDDIIRFLFVDNNSGYYCGLAYLNRIHGTSQVPALVEVRSRNTDCTLDVGEYANRFRIYALDRDINSENRKYIELLSCIEDMYGYFEDDVVECISYIVGKLGLDSNALLDYAQGYSDRTLEVVRNAVS